MPRHEIPGIMMQLFLFVPIGSDFSDHVCPYFRVDSTQGTAFSLRLYLVW